MDDLDADTEADAEAAFEPGLTEDGVPFLEDRVCSFSLAFSLPLTLGLDCPLVLEDDEPCPFEWVL